MRKDDISRLLQRYLASRKEGKEPYFDADEIDELLNSFDESDNYTYYDEVLALGLKLHPGNVDLQVRQCRQYVYNQNYASALALIDEIADTDNQDLDMLRLECYCSLNHYEKVVEFIEGLIASQCEYLETIFEYIAPILNDLEMHKEAHDFIDRGRLLFPDNLILKDELCYTLETEGDVEQAIRICNELIDQNPYSNDYWFTLGRLYSMISEYDKAIEAFDFALTCDDTDVELKLLKAYCLYMNESYEKAIDVYNEIKDEEEAARIKPFMSDCFIKLENYQGGYELLKDLVKEDTLAQEPSAYINFVRCCLEIGHTAEGVKALEKAVRLFPDNVNILSLLALTSMENGDQRQAVDATHKLFNVLDSRPDPSEDDCDNLFQTGQYLYIKGDIEQALKYYNKVLQFNPDYPHLHLHLAIAYLAQGDLKHFGEHFRQTSSEEILTYLKSTGIDINKLEKDNVLFQKYIPPEDLAREYLRNKDHSN